MGQNIKILILEVALNSKDINKFPPDIPWWEFSADEMVRLSCGVVFEPKGTIAFGIPISSRYGVDKEMKDMIFFASEVARADIAWAIKEVFYDSSDQICNISFKEGGGEDYCLIVKSDQLQKIANHTLERHDLFGSEGGYIHFPTNSENGDGVCQAPDLKRDKNIIMFPGVGAST